MIVSTPSELINVHPAALTDINGNPYDYELTYIENANRPYQNGLSGLGIWQTGQYMQHGNLRGPVFRLHFDYINTTSYPKVEIFAVGNTSPVIFNSSYLLNINTLDVIFKSLNFLDSSGSIVTPTSEGNGYNIIGAKYPKNIII